MNSQHFLKKETISKTRKELETPSRILEIMSVLHNDLANFTYYTQTNSSIFPHLIISFLSNGESPRKKTHFLTVFVGFLQTMSDYKPTVSLSVCPFPISIRFSVTRQNFEMKWTKKRTERSRTEYLCYFSVNYTVISV